MRTLIRAAMLLPAAVGLLTATLPAQARDIPASELPSDMRFKREVDESGPLAKVLFLPGGPAYTMGGGGVQYFGNHFYFGGRGWGGVAAGGGMGFGGVVAGASGDFGPAFWRADLTFGGGGGGGGNLPSAGFMGAEPNLGIGLRFGEGAQADVYAGYLVTSSPAFTGPSVGLRLGFKTVSYHAEVSVDQDPLSQ